MLRILMILSLICWSRARPAEEPTRFTLGPVESHTEEILSTRLEQGKELLGLIVDAMRIARGRFVNSIILTRNIIVNHMEQVIGEYANNLIPIVTRPVNESDHNRRSSIPIESVTPVIMLQSEQWDTVRLENETAQGILERRKPDNVRQTLDSILRPTPIVDGIKEEEKYGNTGDRFIGIGRTVVNAFESFSNFLNTVVDLPVNAAKQTSRRLTETLNQLGARIIGLQ